MREKRYAPSSVSREVWSARVGRRPEEQHGEPQSRSIRLARSLVSVVWTVIASSVAIALGITGNSAVLVAFGAIGFVDALGSVALVYHFRHALRTTSCPSAWRASRIGLW
jgi:hypothetical protein